jgi:hypothetical protein
LELSVLHQVVVDRSAEGTDGPPIRTTAYYYHLRERSGPEVILFHWHPFPKQVPFPHLHLAGGAGSVAIDARRHVPTGLVPLAAVIRFAIEELGVRPLRGDWRKILDRIDQGTEPGYGR